MLRPAFVLTLLCLVAGCGDAGQSRSSPERSSEVPGEVTVDEVAAVFRQTDEGGCERDDIGSREAILQRLESREPYYEEGTKGFAEDERRSAVIKAVIEELPATEVVTEHDCSTPGSRIYSVDDERRVILVEVCCQPKDDLVSRLRNTGAKVDPSPLPDDGSADEPLDEAANDSGGDGQIESSDGYPSVQAIAGVFREEGADCKRYAEWGTARVAIDELEDELASVDGAQVVVVRAILDGLKAMPQGSSISEWVCDDRRNLGPEAFDKHEGPVEMRASVYAFEDSDEPRGFVIAVDPSSTLETQLAEFGVPVLPWSGNN